jgi:hypothetical protein
MPRNKAKLVPAIIASLTLGLAPFSPEPHIVGKLRWIAGGAEGMQPIDWLDTIMHGAPWLWLMIALIGLKRSNAQLTPDSIDQ